MLANESLNIKYDMSYSELQELNNEINIEWASDHVSNDSLLQGPLKIV